jgi:NADH:ubiquinone reductase (H+-translocating)
MNGKTRHRVVIIGAGFGGLNAAKTLGGSSAEVTVIDTKNHHTFQPLLYQVATAGLSPGEIAEPIRSILRHDKNIEVILAEVTGFDLARRVVQTSRQQEVPYDSLIVAAGARHSYFGHNEWETVAPGLKTIEDALDIRRRVLLAFEVAEREAAAGTPAEPLTFVVVGAGPTGVELAGTLAEICRHSLPGDFRRIAPERTRIQLIEGGPRVLAAYAEDLSRSALKQLQRLGVEVTLSAMVTNIEKGYICVGNTRRKADLVVWAAGVAASPLGKKLGVDVDRAGRVPVGPDLSIAGHPEVFVIGDLAALHDREGKMLPGVAPVAILEGRYVGKLLRREVERQNRGDSKPVPRKPFHYFDKGSLATIGRAAAVAQFGPIHISGFLAWLAWLFIHILFLIGFRNRVIVVIQWASSYFTCERGARLITGNDGEARADIAKAS